MKALVIMTRIPVPEKTKTRLLTILSPEECADIHKSFLKDITKTALSLKSVAHIFLAYGDEGPLNLLEGIIPEEISFFPQNGQNLGEKMENIFIRLFQEGYEKVVLIGSDIPEITAKNLEDSFYLLEFKDVVLGPTGDGGYYLVGMKTLHKTLFSKEIKWGSPVVFQESIKKLECIGLSLGFLESREDIDTQEDLRKFWDRIKETEKCENTRKYLKSKRIWGDCDAEVGRGNI